MSGVQECFNSQVKLPLELRELFVEQKSCVVQITHITCLKLVIYFLKTKGGLNYVGQNLLELPRVGVETLT